MRTREEVLTEAKDLVEILSTYKVLKLEQLYRTIRNKEEHVKMSIIRILQHEDRLFIHDDLASACENWTKYYDKGMITAFWILLDFWDEVLYNTSASFPAKIDFITESEAFDVVIAEKGQEKMLNVFYGKERDKAMKHLVAVENERQMGLLNFEGIGAFCIVEADGTVSYYRNEG